MPKRQLTGQVISAKMAKTVVVRVERLKKHLKYQKRFKARKNYKAHDENKEYQVGDRVIIEECRPISKDKKWKVVGKIGHSEVISPDELEAVSNIPEPEVIEENNT